MIITTSNTIQIYPTNIVFSTRANTRGFRDLVGRIYKEK
jgi:hypothetical protein